MKKKVFWLIAIAIATMYMAIMGWSQTNWGGNDFLDANGNPLPSSEVDRIMAHGFVEEGIFTPDGKGGYYMTPHGVDVYGSAADRAKWGTNGTNPAHAPGSAVPGAPAGGSSQASKPAIEYGHDYPELSEEAVEALEHFTSDGKPDSAYLNIEATSSQNKLTGKTLNLSRTNKEDLVVRFVSEDRIRSEWTISDWESEDDIELDLGSTLEEDEESEYKGTYELSFADGGEISNDVTYKINLEKADAEFFVYERSGEEYAEIYKGRTDGEGMLELHPSKLTEYVISLTDIIAEREAEAKRLEEEKAKEEAKRIEEEKAKAEAEAKAKEEAEAKEATAENAEEPEPEEDVSATPEPRKEIPWIPIGVGVVACIGLIAVIAKKK